MLVLGRKLGQRIVVLHLGLEVTVLAIDRNTVRLGVSAPKQVAVCREEVWRRLGQETHDPPSERRR
jgi:carbon storage regulator